MKLVIAVVVFLLASAGVNAQQTTGSISGSVRDSSGLALAGAKVRLVNVANSAEREVQTNESGDFVINGVDPGQYTLSAQITGFKTFEKKGIVLTTAERLAVGDLQLQLGDVAERITVTAVGASVQTASAERSGSITSRQVEELLVYGRTVTSLLALVPGVVDPTGAEGRNISGGSATSFNVNGNRTAQNNLMLDGVTMTAVGGAANGTFGVSTEAVSEVKILLSNYQAEYGRLAGSNVQILTKSGSRDYHASGLYYKRHEQFNANSFFNNRIAFPKARDRFNTYTYNVGGPVNLPGTANRFRDKMFFFWNHEYVPAKVNSAVQQVTMPSALERRGDFSQSVDVSGRLIPIVDPTTRQPVPGNVMPANRLDANGQALLNFFPLPNFFNTDVSRRAYNFVTRWGGENPLTLYTLKYDYIISSKDSLSVTISPQFSRNTSPNGAQMTAQFPVLKSVVSSKGGNASIHYRRIFSPTMVNELMVGYAYTFGPPEIKDEDMKALQRGTYGFKAGSLNPGNNPLDLMPGMTFGGVVGAASLAYDGRFPFNGARNVYNVSDTLAKNIGSHTLKAGVFFERLRQRDGPWATNFAGNFDFGVNANNPFNSGYAFANAMHGVFNTYTEATAHPVSRIYSRGVDFFVQDTWKVSRKLTLDYGMRFTWYEPFWNFNDQLAGFAPQLYDPKQTTQLIRPALVNGVRMGVHPVTGAAYSPALIGFVAPGTGNPFNGMAVTSRDPTYPRALVKTSGLIPVPRFGFAYDPFGDGKTAVRGGFGMFTSRILGVNSPAIFSYPLVQTPVVQFGTLSTFRSAQGFTSPPSVTGWERDMKSPNIMNMSLTVQRNIGHGTVIDVGYVGTLGRNLSWQRSLQDVPRGARFLPANSDPTNTRVPLPDAFLRPIGGYNAIDYRENAGSSNYHSLQATAQRRFTRKLEFGLAYTWSKALDFNDGEFGGINTAAPFRAWNYGLAGFDRTHILKLNWLWDVPKYNWSFKPMRYVTNDWQISGILTFQSGAPVGVGYSQVTPVDLSGTPSVAPRILVVSDPVLPKGDRTFTRNFVTEAFRLPALGTLGTMSKNLIRGPGINNWDIAVFKNFPVKERFRFQFRAEMYNAFNHTQFSTFDATARFDASGNQINGQFGQFTAARSPRLIQMSLRLGF
ncbi:MAG: carboxypeptidase regulatory-like domain-containing protein [Candidatus Solibacter usitatus]|nr:carboxypeptidase regulatory-like domain-containing protein [Candidatus Solibacter usitatus]